MQGAIHAVLYCSSKTARDGISRARTDPLWQKVNGCSLQGIGVSPHIVDISVV